MFDPGPLQLTTFNTGETMLSRMLSRLQENVAAWVDRLRLGEGYEDIYSSPLEGLATSALTTEQIPDGSSVLYKCFRHDQTDDLTIIKKFPHKWSGGVVHPHLHVMPLAAGAGNLAFSWKYAWLAVNDKLPGYTDMGEVQLPLTADHQYKHTIVPLGDLTPPDKLGLTSAFLLLFIERNRNGGDTYNTNKGWGTLQANVALLDVGTHERERIFGSETEFR